jgi:hypothetical protein
MAITFWRNVQRKLTTTEMDANFDTLVSEIANAGLSAEMPEGQIYIGDNTNTATLDTLDTSIVPETTDKRYQSDLQDTYNDATSSIQTQLNNKLDLDGGNANQDIDIDGFGVNAKHFKVNGTAGAGHIGLKHQSANISASASESSIGADSVGDPVWKNDGGAIDKLELQSNKTGTVTGNEASTSKYLTVKGVYDWAIGLFAPKASPTFTGTVTTPDIVVSGATINTIAHFDGTKNIESLPLATYPSLTELSYVKGVTSALQTQINAKLSGSGLTNNYLSKYNGTVIVNSTITENGTTTRFTGTNSSLGTTLIEYYNSLGAIGYVNNDGSYQNLKQITVENAGVAAVTLKNTGNIATFKGSTSGSGTSAVSIANTTGAWAYFNDNRWVQFFTANSSSASIALSLQEVGTGNFLWRFLNDGSFYMGNGTKDASAILQADSTTKGSLPAPRMTNVQRTNIVSPAIGLMVYCTDTIEGLYIYKSTGWTFII